MANGFWPTTPSNPRQPRFFHLRIALARVASYVTRMPAGAFAP